MEVRKATDADIPDILRLVDKVHVKNLASLKDGFLMIPNATAVLYQFWFTFSPYCYVAVSDGKVTGFLAALPGSVLDPKVEIHGQMIKMFAGKEILLVVQAAVDPEFRRAGIGSAMYEKLFLEAGEAIVLSSSIKEPFYNYVSERFHLAMGFKKIGEFQGSDKTKAYMYRWINTRRGGKIAEPKKRELKTEERTVDLVMNCPFTSGDGRRDCRIVDKKTCSCCRFHHWKDGCVYAEVNLATKRTAVFDEESKTSLFFWRFKCCYCHHPVFATSSFRNRPSAEPGRCSECGAFYYFIRWEYGSCPDKEKWWYAVTKPDTESIGNLNERDSNREYQARIPDRRKEKPESSKGG